MTRDVVKDQETAGGGLTERVAERVRIERARRGIAQRELAEKMGVGPNWVSNRETGKQQITLRDVEDLASALGLRHAELLGIDGAEPLPLALREVVEILEDPQYSDTEKRALLTVHRHATQMWREMRGTPHQEPAMRKGRSHG